LTISPCIPICGAIVLFLSVHSFKRRLLCPIEFTGIKPTKPWQF
jgi:hypothetical protein